MAVMARCCIFLVLIKLVQSARAKSFFCVFLVIVGLVCLSAHCYNRQPKSLPFRTTTMGPYFGKILNGSQWRETTNILISFELCPELHI